VKENLSELPGFLASEIGTTVGKPMFTVIPVPLEQTVSYGAGTARGPEVILEASQQLEAWDGLSVPLEAGIATASVVDCSGDIETILARISTAVEQALVQDSLPVVLGGEHTVSLAPLRALGKVLQRPFGIIQLDAHADLRGSFEGSIYSHACVMHRAVTELGCSLFQFGIRALCLEEVEFRKTWNVHHLDSRQIHGADLSSFNLPEDFPQDIYLTLDVDGLDPSVIGATGTPVPGGPGWWDTLRFLERAIAGRKVIGFDVVELAPRPHDHASDFAAAQLVYSVMGLITRNGK